MFHTRTAAALGLAAVTGFGVLALAGAGQPPAANPPAPQTGVTPVSQVQMTPVQPQVDPADQMITDAKASFARVKDYMGTLVKEEKVGGQLQPEQYIAFRIRQQPFSAYLKWTGPKQFEGQEAMYVAGKNGGKMKAKATGLAAVAGYVSLDPTDPRALRQSRHAITETGIGHLIETIARGYQAERALPPAQVQTRYGEYAFQQRPCTRMETVHLVNTGQFYGYRTVVYFDKGLHLPVRFEAYDWPAAGGNPQGELLECYSYIDLKFNVGLTDAAFGF
jgi:Protein of unknown function (DUF1571)